LLDRREFAGRPDSGLPRYGSRIGQVSGSKDAYRVLILEDVPADHLTKEIAV
jgi:hypothetical protein